MAIPAVSLRPAERGAAARRASARGRVRTLERGDLPALVSLYLRVFGPPPSGGAAVATAYLERLLFAHPWPADDLPSLVFEDADGEPAGLLGVVPRPVERRGQRLRLAIGHHFMVAPEARGTLASVQLMRAFLKGPQDIAVLEACTPWRKLWEALGGSVALLPGLKWTCVFAPCRAAVGLVASRWPPARRLLGPAAIGDRLAARVFPRWRPEPAGPLVAHPLDAAALSRARQAIRRSGPRVVLSEAAATWVLDHLAAKTHRGRLVGTMLCQESGEPAGWYLYYLKPLGLSHVVAIEAAADHLETVFAHMVSHARAHGVGALAGQIDKALLGVAGIAAGLIQQPVDSWQLVHALAPDLLNDVHSGHFPLSRLESDWWMTY
jgi:hypothetical protein